MGLAPRDHERLLGYEGESWGGYETARYMQAARRGDHQARADAYDQFRKDHPGTAWTAEKSGRILGAAGGALEAGVGTLGLLAPAPEPAHKVGSAILVGHGLDTLQANVRGLFSEDDVPTVTKTLAYKGSRAAGLGETASEWISTGVDLAPALLLGRPSSGVSRTSSSGAFDDFVRQSHALPDGVPVYAAGADDAAKARWVIGGDGKGFLVREFEYTDLMRKTPLRKHVADVRANGLKNPVINYTVVGDTPYVLFGNNRLHAARSVPGMTDALMFEQVTLPFRGYKTADDVVNSAAEVSSRLSGGR